MAFGSDYQIAAERPTLQLRVQLSSMRALNAGWKVIVSQFAGESLSIAQQRSKVVWSEARLATQGMLDDRGREGENFRHRLVSKNVYRLMGTARQLQPPSIRTLADLARLPLSLLGPTLQARIRARESTRHNALAWS